MSDIEDNEGYAAGDRSLFFVAMASSMLVLNFIGFGESYFLRLLDTDSSMSLTMHVHVALGFGLFALFVAQTFFAYRNRFAIHNKTGPIVAVLSLLLVVAGIGMIQEVAEGYISNPTEDQVIPALIQASSVWVSLFVEFSFAIFMGLAILLRAKGTAHKRLVFLAFVGITSPALARMGQFPVLGLSPAVFTLSSMLLLVAALAIYDFRSRGKVHVITLVGGAVQVVGLGLFAAVLPYTGVGQKVVLWLS